VGGRGDWKVRGRKGPVNLNGDSGGTTQGSLFFNKKMEASFGEGEFGGDAEIMG